MPSLKFASYTPNHETLLLRIIAIFLVFSFGKNLESSEDDLSDLYGKGKEAYDKGQYHAAKKAFDILSESYPACAKCQHMRGKSYGRLAEKSGWFKAIKYAPITLEAFEKAYDLAPNNTTILKDLITFYKRAPFFLGGSTSKAMKLEAEMRKLEARKTPIELTAPLPSL